MWKHQCHTPEHRVEVLCVPMAGTVCWDPGRGSPMGSFAPPVILAMPVGHTQPWLLHCEIFNFVFPFAFCMREDVT